MGATKLDTHTRVMATTPEKEKSETETEVVAIKRAEFAKRWSMCLRQLDHLVEAGIVPTIKLGRRMVRVPVKQADAALMAYQTGGKEVA